MSSASGAQVSSHPLVAHKLTCLRDKDTDPQRFRALITELGMLMAYEACADLATELVEVETPLEVATAPRLSAAPALVSVLRAGQGLVEGMLRAVPEASVGHVGLYRDPETLEAIEYYCKLPPLAGRLAIVCDPMLATGHSAVAALSKVAAAGPAELRFACVLAAPEGVEHIREHFPEVKLHIAGLDRELNSKGYICPGLGDAGDRIYGT